MMDLTNITGRMEHFEKLVPTATRLYEHMDRVAQASLLPLFLLSILMAYSKDLGLAGAVVGRLKRLVVAALLLAVFPDLSSFIQRLGSELASSIDNMEGIDAILKASAAGAKGYSLSSMSLLELSNDLILWAMVHGSYVFLYVARLGLVAFYHFYWLFLISVAPLLILTHLFEATSQMAQNLFKNIFIVALWPVAWSILSCFLKALPYASAYEVEGGYTALVVMNLIIASALFFSPFLISSFCEGLLVGTGSVLYSASKAAVGIVAPKVGAVAGFVADRSYPAYQRNVPKRLRSTVDWVFRRPSYKLKISFIVLVSFALSGHSALAQTIVLHPSKAVVFCLKDNPRTVVLGDAKSFRASKIGPKQILLQGFVQGKTTNLVVLGKDQAVRSLPLVTDIGQPFLAKIECDPDLRPSPNQTEQRRSLPTVSDRSVRVAVTSLKWNAKTRDYLNLSFEVTNLTGRLIRMRWGELVLLSGEKKIPHSRLWAARRELPPGAKVLVRTEFKKPELAMFPVNILVLFDDLELRVPLKEEDLK